MTIMPPVAALEPILKGAAQEKVFGADANYFDWVAGGGGDCSIGGTGINYNDFSVCNCLLDDATEEAANVRKSRWN